MCLRVVSFYTPVPLDEVLAFYNTRALAAGFNTEHVKAAGDNILSGTKGEALMSFTDVASLGRDRDRPRHQQSLITRSRPDFRPTPMLARGCSISVLATG